MISHYFTYSAAVLIDSIGRCSKLVPNYRAAAGNFTIFFGNSASAIQTSIILRNISLIRSGIGTPIRSDVLRRRRIRFWSSASSANPFRRNFTMFGGGSMCLVLITPFPNLPAKVLENFRASGGNYRDCGVKHLNRGE